MTPDELCDRVLHLSGAPGVPPIVSTLLGQAVARYRSERVRRQGRWWSVVATVASLGAAGWFLWAGFFNLLRLELELSTGTEPLIAAAWGGLGIAELAASLGFSWLARRMFGHWRHFWRAR